MVLSHAGQLLQALNKRSAIRLHRASVCLGVLPLFHVGGLSIALAVAMAAGTLVLHPPGGERPWEAAWRAAAALARAPRRRSDGARAHAGRRKRRAAGAAVR